MDRGRLKMSLRASRDRQIETLLIGGAQWFGREKWFQCFS